MLRRIAAAVILFVGSACLVGLPGRGSADDPARPPVAAGQSHSADREGRLRPSHLPTAQLGAPQLGPPQLPLPQLPPPQAGPTLPPSQSVPGGPAQSNSPAPNADEPDFTPRPDGDGGIDLGFGAQLRPDGFLLPGGLGFIQRAPDHIGVQLNTPDGILQFNVPRRQRMPQDSGNLEAAPTPSLEGAEPSSGVNDRSGGGAHEGESGRAAREFASAARAFRARNYSAALRRVNRALARYPGDRELLQLRSLVNFAVGDDGAAYRDAVVILAAGDVWDWATLRAQYRTAAEYTAQYRALEDRARANRNAVEPWFVLGYHNLMLGNHDASQRQFEHVAALDPTNETARRLATAKVAPTSNSAGPSHPQPPAGIGAGGAPFSIDLGPPTETIRQRKDGAKAPR